MTRDAAIVVGAASAAEIGAYLALDSTLASLAAFGSVLGLGVLHLRTRRARAQPKTPNAPTAPQSRSTPIDVMQMPSLPDYTPAIDDLRFNVEKLERALHATQNAEQERAADAAARVAASLVALETRVASAEANLTAQTNELQRALVDGAERAGERGRDAIARLCRDLATLREDVGRASLGIADLAGARRAPVTLADEHARAIANAAEQGAALARRLGAMHDTIEGALRRMETGETTLAGRLEDLGREAQALHAMSTRLGDAMAASEARLHKAIDGAARDMTAAIARLPSPEPVAAPLREAEARILARLDTLAAQFPEPTSTDLAPVMERLAAVREAVARIPPPETLAPPLREAEARIVARVEKALGEMPTPAPTDLAPLQHKLDEIASALASLPRPEPVQGSLRESEARIVSRIEKALAQMPRPSAPDMTPLAADLHELRESLARIPTPEPVSGPLREAETRLSKRIDAALAAMPSAPDMAPVLTSLRDLRESLARLPAPEPVAAPLRDAEARLAHRIDQALAKVPAPANLDLTPLEAALRETRDLLTNLPPPQEIAAPLRDAEARIVARIEKALARLPEPESVDLAPMLTRLDQLREQSSEIRGKIDGMEFEQPLAEAEARLSRALERATRATAEAIAARPENAVPAIEQAESRLHDHLAENADAVAKLSDDMLAAEARIHAHLDAATPDFTGVHSHLRDTEERIVAHVDNALRSLPSAPSQDFAPVLERLTGLRDAISRLPAPESVEAPLRETETRILARIDHALRDAVSRASPAVSPVEPALRETETRLMRHVDAAMSQFAGQPNIDLSPVLDRLATIREAITHAPAPEPVEAPLRETEARIIGRIEHALHEAFARMPAPEPVAASLRESENRILAGVDRAIAGLDETDLAPLAAKVDEVRQAIERLPQPEPVAAPLRESETRILAGVERAMRAMPPTPTVDLAPVLDRLTGLREAIARLPGPEPIETPLRESEARMAARMEKTLREAVARAPAPSPVEPALRASEERIIRELHDALGEMPVPADVGPVLDKLSSIREAIARLPAPENFEPALREAEARLRAHVDHAISRLPAPEAANLAPVMDKLAGIRDAIAHLPDPEPFTPAVRESEGRIVASVRAAEERLARAVAAMQDRAADMTPLQELVDPARFERALRATEERVIRSFPVDAVTEQVRASEDRILRQVGDPLRLAGLQEKIETSIQATAERLASTQRRELAGMSQALRDAIAAIPAPPAMPLDAIRESVAQTGEHVVASQRAEAASAIRAIRETIAAMPAFPLDEIRAALDERMHALAASQRQEHHATVRAVRDALATLPPPPEFPMRELRAALAETAERVVATQREETVDAARNLREAIAAIPPPEFPTRELKEAVVDARDHLAEIQRSEVAGAIRAIREAIAAIPAPPEFPVHELQGSIAEARHELANLQREETAAAIRTIRDAIAAIPAPPEFPVHELQGSIAETRHELANLHREETAAAIRTIRDAIAAIPTPPEFPVHELQGSIAETRHELANLHREETAAAVRAIREAIATIPPHPEFPLQQIQGSIAEAQHHLAATHRDDTAAAVRAMREAIAAIPAPPEFPLAEIRAAFDARLHALTESQKADTAATVRAVRDAVASLPPPPEFPLDDIRAAFDARASALAETQRADAAATIRAVREAVAALPAPPEFPLAAIEAAIRDRSEEVITRQREEFTAAVAAISAAVSETANRQAGEMARSFAATNAAIDATTVPMAALRGEIDDLRALAKANEDGRRQDARAIQDALAATSERIDHSSHSVIPELLSAHVEALVAEMRAHRAVDADRLDAAHARLAAADEERKAAQAALEREMSALSGHVGDLLTLRGELAAGFDGLRRDMTAAFQNESRSTAANFDAVREANAALMGRFDNAHETIQALAPKLDAAAKASEDATVSLHDAIEDVRAENDARQRRTEALLAHMQETQGRALAAALSDMRRATQEAQEPEHARAEAFMARLERLSRDLDARWQAMEERASQREQEADRRFNARIAALEARLLDEMRATGSPLVTAEAEAAPALPPLPRIGRRAPRNESAP